MFSLQKKVYPVKDSNVIIFLTGWGTSQWSMWLFGKILQAHHFTTIIYTYDKSILSTDIHTTVENFKKVKKDVLGTIDALPKNQQKNVTLLGTSIGSILAMYCAPNSTKIKKLVLNLVGASLADIVWSWDSGRKTFKKDLLAQNITLDQLQSTWHEIAPITNLSGIIKKKVLIYSAVNDEVIPFSQAELFIKGCQEKRINTETVINTTHNHFVSTLVHLLKYPVYLDFIKNK